MKRPFRQVNVFSSDPLLGNPLAVVHAADGLSEEQMAGFARWTHLSETTFLLAPTDPDADYRVRIFTPAASCPSRDTRHSVPATRGSPREGHRASLLRLYSSARPGWCE